MTTQPDSSSKASRRAGRAWRLTLVVSVLLMPICAWSSWLLTLPAADALGTLLAVVSGTVVAFGVCLLARHADLRRVGALIIFVAAVAIIGLAFPHHYAGYACGLALGTFAALAGDTFLATLSQFIGPRQRERERD